MAEDFYIGQEDPGSSHLIAGPTSTPADVIQPARRKSKGKLVSKSRSKAKQSKEVKTPIPIRNKYIEIKSTNPGYRESPMKKSSSTFSK